MKNICRYLEVEEKIFKDGLVSIFSGFFNYFWVWGCSISEFGTITMKMISSAINNGREQTKIGSINIRVVPPAPQRFFCQRPMVMSVTVGRLKWQADEVPVWGFSLLSLPMTGDGSKDIFIMLDSNSAPDQIAWVESVMVAAITPGSTTTAASSPCWTAPAHQIRSPEWNLWW